MSPKDAIAVAAFLAAVGGCAVRDRGTTNRAASHPSQTQTTGATLPAAVQNPAPDPFDAEAYAPARTTAEPPRYIESEHDEEVSNRVRQRIAADPSLRDALTKRVEVITYEGHVTLRGWVPTVADKVTMEQRAREAQGVVDVRNELTTSDQRCGLGGIRC